MSLQRAAGNAATTALVVQRQPSDTTIPADGPQPGERKLPSGVSDSYITFNSVYQAYCGTYSFLAQKQHDAVSSIYTEAKNIRKPSLVEDLLVALAMTALGVVVGTLGAVVEQKVGEKLLKSVADPKWTDNPTLKAAAQKAQDAAKALSKGAKEGFMDGIKEFVGPKVQELVRAGKKPVDAFFEGQLDGVTDAGKKTFQDAQLKEPDLWALHEVHPELPLLAAQALLDSVNEEFAQAEELQKRETLRHWLQYEAQARLGTGTTFFPTHGTDLRQPVSNSNAQASALSLGSPPGILWVQAYVEGTDSGRATPSWPTKPYTVFADYGIMRGLTPPMLTTLAGTPIFNLQLPIVYVISSEQGLDGRGVRRTEATTQQNDFFCIGVNESGATFQGSRYPWQEKALQQIGGIQKLLNQLGMYYLANLGVEADSQD